jgi:regulator of replication initiation timing
MSVHDDLTSVQRCLDDLYRSVGRLEKQLGSGGLEMRRVRTDAEHLRESVALLRAVAASPAAQNRPDLVTISDTPYDPALWTDSDDEGLGARDRRAP